MLGTGYEILFAQYRNQETALQSTTKEIKQGVEWGLKEASRGRNTLPQNATSGFLYNTSLNILPSNSILKGCFLIYADDPDPFSL